MRLPPPDGVVRDPERAQASASGESVTHTAVTRRPRATKTSPHEQLPTLRMPPVEARAVRRAAQAEEDDDALPLHSGEIVLEPDDVEVAAEPPAAPTATSRATDVREQLPTLRLATIPTATRDTNVETSPRTAGPRLHRPPQPLPEVLRDGPRRLAVANETTARAPSPRDEPAPSAAPQVAERKPPTVIVERAADAVPATPSVDVVEGTAARPRRMGLAILTTAVVTFAASWFVVPALQRSIGGSPSSTATAVEPSQVATEANALAAASLCVTAPATEPTVASDAVAVAAPAAPIEAPNPVAPTLAPSPTDGVLTTPTVATASADVSTTPDAMPPVAPLAAAPPSTSPAIATPPTPPTSPVAVAAAEPVAAPAPEAPRTTAAPSKSRARASRSQRAASKPAAPVVAAPAPARSPTPATGPDALGLLREAERALADGRHGTALRNAQKSEGLRRDPRATRIVAISACKLGRADVARAAIDRLPAGQRRGVRNTCRDAGVKL